MGSKFLGTGSNDLGVLQDGSFALNVATADVQSLVPNMPVRASATHSLVSGLIEVADCNFTPLTNPAVNDLNMNNKTITHTREYGFEQNGDPSTPPLGNLTVYNSSGNLNILDDSSNTRTVATTDLLTSYLPLAGGTMTGSINMGTHEITNTGAYRVSATNIILGDSKTNASSTNSTAIGDSAVATSQFTVAIGSNSSSTATSAVCIGPYCTASDNSTIAIGSSAKSNAYRAISIGNSIINSTTNSVLFGVQLNIRANTTTCDLGTTANPFQTLYLNTNIAGPTYSRSADNILSCATNGTSGNLATFTGTAKVIQDSGTALSSLATTASLASYLPLAGGTMTGTINMGTQEVTNAGAYRMSATNIIVGDSKTNASSTNSIAIGDNTVTTSQYAVAIGSNSSSTFLNTVTIGSNSSSTALSAVSIGPYCTASNTCAIAIGASVISNAFRAIAIGNTLTNATANSVLFGAQSNIRANTTTCDLGTTANPFQTLYLNTNIAGPTYSRSADNILSCATNGTVGNLATFTGTAKVIQDSGTSLSSLATTASLAAYLPLAGGTMTGSINMGTSNIVNIGRLQVAGNVLLCDSGSSSSGAESVLVGIIDQSSSDYTTIVGSRITVDNASIGATCIGRGSVATGSSYGVAIGHSTSVLNSNHGIAIGAGSTSFAQSANILGYALSNSTANSLLIDASSNFRSSSTTCDLGTTANPFQSLYISNVYSSAALNLGTSTSTSVNIGRSGITVGLTGALTSNTNSVPVWRCSYSNTTVGFSLTTAESDVLQGTLAGSLVIPAPTSAGFTLKMFGSWYITLGAATTFTLRFKVNGTTMLTTTIPAGVVTNQLVHIDHMLQLRTPSNRIYITNKIIRNGGTTSLNTNLVDSVWLTNASNTISMTGQFSDTNGVWRGDYLDMWSSHTS